MDEGEIVVRLALWSRVGRSGGASMTMANDFNELEVAILEWLKDTYANSQLAAQIESATFANREWTEVGFYVHLKVPRELDPINLDDYGGQWPIDGPNLASDDIDQGGGTVLWGTDGYIDCIEMYAHGKSFSETVSGFELLSL
jgi:hypothetical protein